MVQKDVNLARLLLSYGADVNQDRRYESLTFPLHFASFTGPCELVQLLLDYGVDVNRRDYKDQGPLHFAVGLMERRVADDWLNGGTPRQPYDICPTDSYRLGRRMPSLVAAEPDEQVKITRLLLDYGADPQARDWQGLSPWMAPMFQPMV